MENKIPPAVNFHLWKPCNLRCLFCYAVFEDDPQLKAVRGGLGEPDARRVVELLRAAGAEKITFVGGEPTLCPHLASLLRRSRGIGLVTTIVTNGGRLKAVLNSAPGCTDWVGLSVDSADEAVQAALGRGRGGHVSRSIEYARLLRELGIRIKLNTVITELNWQEDMTDLVLQIGPERWKVLQVLPIVGQNDGKVEPLLIGPEQFQSFVDRHRAFADRGIMVPESNEDMTGSYAMVDPLGRFFSNVGGRYTYSPSILKVGVESAFSAVAFDPSRFDARGGHYDWGSATVRLTVAGR